MSLDFCFFLLAIPPLCQALQRSLNKAIKNGTVKDISKSYLHEQELEEDEESNVSQKFNEKLSNDDLGTTELAVETVAHNIALNT